jgi:hypothetical protein
MTINIALSTSEGLVLACDSIASSIGYFLPAFGRQVEVQPDGSYVAKYKFNDVVTHVTNSWGGVTKMFPLHGGETPVAAITAGLAKLGERTMSSCALEFFRRQQTAGNQLNTLTEVGESFLAFMRAKYDDHYANSTVPEEFRDGPMFLLGGYGRADYLPSICRVDVKGNRTVTDFGPGQGGISWEGQSDAVERLIRGYDNAVRIAVERAVTDGVKQIREAAGKGIEQALQQVVDRLGADKVGDMRIELPETDPIVLPWDGFNARISFSNLPLQDAIDFAAYLVNIQSGRAKFTEGVPTVGGRTHIGLITRQDGFKMIDEVPLTHRNPGFV